MKSISSSISDGGSHRASKPFSCVRCFERKVKCDKNSPCSSCIRSKVECVFRTPAPARRRKKRSQEEILQARINHYEALLRQHGIDLKGGNAKNEIHDGHEGDGELEVTAENEAGSSPSSSRRSLEGQIYVSRGKSTFVENSLWNSLSGEIDQPRDLMPESSDEEETDGTSNRFIGDPFRVDLVLGYIPDKPASASLHPTPDHILKLWQIFLENINPLTKIIHQPTVQNTLLEVAFDIKKVKRTFEPLMFAIYSTAVMSMTDEDCQKTFGEYKAMLFSKYSLGMRQTLTKSRFLGTGDLCVLQAFTLFLFAMRASYRAQTMWVLAGIASRIGQCMGLHRDGTSLGLPVFETEMRRRLWWQITMLESRLAELTGGPPRGPGFLDSSTKIPLNVNDADLYPGMKDAPEEHTKPTEMIFCLIRYSIGVWLRRKKSHTVSGSVYNVPWADGSQEDTNKLIDELEQDLEEKYLRYLDPSSPIQFHASIVARAAIGMMRFTACHHLHQGVNTSDPSKMDPTEREMLSTTSMKIMECYNLVHSTKSTQRFLWHTHGYFQWHALIYLLSDLRVRPEGIHADKAWKQVEEIYFHHPDFVTENRRALYIAVGNLCLKAWNARERALARQAQGLLTSNPPQFITLLRKQRAEKRPFRGSTMNNVVTPPSGPVPEMRTEGLPPVRAPGQEDMIDYGFDFEMEFDPNLLVDTPMSGSESIDWTKWDNLLLELDIPS